MKQTFEYHVENIVIPYKTLTKGARRIRKKSYAKVFRATVAA